MCHVSIASPPFGASAPSTTASAVSRSWTFDVERHELVDDPRVVALAPRRRRARRSARSACESSHGVPGMFPTLTWCASSAAAASNSSVARRVGRRAPLVVRVEEPVHQELELEVLEAVRRRGSASSRSSERVSSTCSRSACQSPMPAEADARRLRAAVARSRTGSTRGRRAPRPGRRSSSRARAGRTPAIARNANALRTSLRQLESAQLKRLSCARQSRPRRCAQWRLTT